MLENLRNITISGGYFEQPTILELFNENKFLSIIFGRNGSGKTTIAKAIRQLVGKDSESSDDESYISYSVSTNVEIPEDKKTSVFIFDEDFVRDNVRMVKNGLETIVMIGEQVALESQIRLKEDELLVLEKEIAEQKIKKEEFEDKKNTSSPNYFFSKIKEKMRENGSWADTDRKARGTTIKTRVTEQMVTKLINLEECEESEYKMHMALQSDLALYDQSKDKQPIIWSCPRLNLPDNLNQISKLLQKKIERPELSEREQRLLAFLEKHAEYHEKEKSLQLVSEKWPFCPLCLRHIDNEDHASISEILKHILNKESETYSTELNQAMDEFAHIEADLPSLPPVNDDEKSHALLAMAELNKDLDIIRNTINQREREIYGVVTEAFNTEIISKYLEHIAEYKNAMRALEDCVMNFNRSVNEREELKKQIIHENNQLIKIRLKELIDGYKQANKAYKKCEETLAKLYQNKEQIVNEINELKARARRTDIALEYINEQLQYVFYSTTKARLVSGNGCYKLKINGRNVSPKKISVGERNVLGLCYFFAQLFSNKSTRDKYKDETLIVIDDPISSFDSGNRLGVMTLLRHQFSNIQKGNAKSRVLVMTHDLRSVFDLCKIRQELNAKNGKYDFYELSNKQISGRKVDNEYKRLLECVYKYAMGRTSEEDEYTEASIGNIMRRVIEAFASFCYNKGFTQMMNDQAVLNLIPSEKRTFYEHFMCRLALNGESHMEERVYELDTVTPFFSREEKIKTAKSLLLFLSYVNKEHLSCYLSQLKDGKEDIMSEIEKMRKEEAKWLI